MAGCLMEEGDSECAASPVTLGWVSGLWSPGSLVARCICLLVAIRLAPVTLGTIAGVGVRKLLVHVVVGLIVCSCVSLVFESRSGRWTV